MAKRKKPTKPARERVRRGLTEGTAVIWPAGLEKRYGISQPTRWHWEKTGRLPPRDFRVGTRTGWKIDTILDSERGAAAVRDGDD